MLKGETVIATIRPLAPPFLDERARAELQAEIQAARSAISLAEVDRQRVQTALDLARSDFSRAERLASSQTISERTLEKAANDVALLEAQERSAEATIRVRRAELATDLARLVEPGHVAIDPAEHACCVELTSPVDGTILKMRLKSAQALSAGTVVADVGDPAKLEVVADLLSADAVRVHPGSKAFITEWGGDRDLPATVRRIDPAGFTKVSALGIEEQRVNVDSRSRQARAQARRRFQGLCAHRQLARRECSPGTARCALPHRRRLDRLPGRERARASRAHPGRPHERRDGRGVRRAPDGR